MKPNLLFRLGGLKSQVTLLNQDVGNAGVKRNLKKQPIEYHGYLGSCS